MSNILSRVYSLVLNDYMKRSSYSKHHEIITEKIILSDKELNIIIAEECPRIEL